MKWSNTTRKQEGCRRKDSRWLCLDGRPNPGDIHVGGRARLGLTFRQVQKYECGANRIGSSRLFDLARILEVPLGFFFDDMAEKVRDEPCRIPAIRSCASGSTT